jgi:hypothetical protein
MKTYRDHEATRRRHHADPTGDTVHRSSLLVPEIPGSDVEISFLNHFLLKRGYRKVACRVTAIDPEGRKLYARLEHVTDARVYRLPLSRAASTAAASYMVEFFAAENLVIPFPAVMINHTGPDFLNSVHAYNRVLNDTFEDDAINTLQSREASIDVEDGAETFVVFMAGAQRCQGSLDLELATPDRVRTSTIALDVPRFCPRVVSLTDAFAAFPAIPTGVLSVRQPRQPMFYGRLLAGRRCPGGAFAANHSYYDSSSSPEYWNDRAVASRSYPFFPDLDAVVRMYPIMSPGRVALSLEAHDAEGRSLVTWDAGELESPGARFLETDVGRELGAFGVERHDVSAFTVHARPLGGETPTRVNHQLLYGRGGLFASLNISLSRAGLFVRAGKTGFAWGQFPVGGDVRSRLGIVTDAPGGDACDVALTLYDEEGEIGQKVYRLAASGSVRVDETDLVPDAIGAAPRRIWYVVRAARPDISAFTVTRHERSGHSSGEHSF